MNRKVKGIENENEDEDEAQCAVDPSVFMGSKGEENKRLSPGNDPDNLQPVAGLKLAEGKFRRRHRIAIVLDNYTPRQQILAEKKLLEGARQLGLDSIPVGSHKMRIHGVSAVSQSFHTGS